MRLLLMATGERVFSAPAHGEICVDSSGYNLYPKNCPVFCCGTCYNQYCCSDILKKFVWDKESCEDRWVPQRDCAWEGNGPGPLTPQASEDGGEPWARELGASLLWARLPRPYLVSPLPLPPLPWRVPAHPAWG